ncbi:MAG TPA: hydroxyethylthiazole kinase [Syntrophales bacterium]|nr:hydroxyethylthiazole kinase [Syntrophales bacterium]HOL58990.1 hydroxyethylthiazole kinase [Syntrophales bacterium]HPO34732.1 hydroxyethylthiazole kinase [Syntrophales bacterium]
MIKGEEVWAQISSVRENNPLVHNITNYVVMNTTANALLAIGASPVMAHAEEEVADMVSIARALVINIGTLSSHWVKSMVKAAGKAQEIGIPIVIDPVGAGATPFRTQAARELIDEFSPAIIRGNPSEIMSLSLEKGKTKGVDSTESSHQALEAARMLAERAGAVVCVSGEIDYVIGPNGKTAVKNGHPLMARVTGLGCTATALCGAFAAVTQDYEKAAICAMAVMGIAGEMAAELAQGPGSMQMHFIDCLYRMTEKDVLERARIEPV